MPLKKFRNRTLFFYFNPSKNVQIYFFWSGFFQRNISNSALRSKKQKIFFLQDFRAIWKIPPIKKIDDFIDLALKSLFVFLTPVLGFLLLKPQEKWPAGIFVKSEKVFLQLKPHKYTSRENLNHFPLTRLQHQPVHQNIIITFFRLFF